MRIINKPVNWLVSINGYQWKSAYCYFDSSHLENLLNYIFKMGVNRKFDFRQVWKFCWDLSNIISGGTVFFRWDLYPAANYGYKHTWWISIHEIKPSKVEKESILFFEFISITLIVVSLFHRLQNFLKPKKNAAFLFFSVIYIKIWNSSLTKFFNNRVQIAFGYIVFDEGLKEYLGALTTHFHFALDLSSCKFWILPFSSSNLNLSFRKYLCLIFLGLGKRQ